MRNYLFYKDLIKTWIRWRIDRYRINVANISLSRTYDGYVCTIDALNILKCNKIELSKQASARFDCKITIDIRKADRQYYSVHNSVSQLVTRCQNRLPSIIYKKVQQYGLFLRAQNIAGYIITVKGKISGPKHVRKKLEYGTNKYTGNYVDSQMFIRTIPINTRQGVIGIKIRINPNTNIPGKFLVLPASNEQITVK